MNPEFWLERWREGRTGFHQTRVMPLLEQHWAALDVPTGARVFVPLAGKSLDMTWLAAQGHRVLGVELSPIAIEQFFDSQKLRPSRHESRYGRHYCAGPFEIICGDAFELDAPALADCAGFYDRAALIALPPKLRERYVGQLFAALPQGCAGLLITLEYPQAQMQGPPFSVPQAEVEQAYGEAWRVELIERRDILAREPSFAEQGVSALATAIYRLRRR